MSTWYRAQFEDITPVEVAYSKDHFVALADNNRRQMRVTEWCAFFPTREEAKQHLVNEALKAVKKADAALLRARTKLENVESL